MGSGTRQHSNRRDSGGGRRRVKRQKATKARLPDVWRVNLAGGARYGEVMQTYHVFANGPAQALGKAVAIMRADERQFKHILIQSITRLYRIDA